MVATCCICGVERTKISERTFHKFPRSDDLRQKWYRAIGRDVKYKTAVVCSDHFRKEDFRSSSGIGVRLLLVANAIPLIICRKNESCNVQNASSDTDKTSEIVSNISRSSSCAENVERILIDDESKICDNDVNYLNERKLDDESIQSEKRVLIDNDTEIYNNDVNCLNKRKLDNEIIQSQKKRVRYQCPQLGTMRREDFVSERAWQQFGNFVIVTKSSIKSVRCKNNRLRQKVNNLQSLIRTLKKQKKLTK